MKIGIITFHWSTNYGAILQAYALQEYLKLSGNEVCVIDYKPKRFDKSLRKLLALRRLRRICKEMLTIWHEIQLSWFRKTKLNLTKRYYTTQQLQEDCPCVDVLICGSDQVWSPPFTRNGEERPTSAYYLDFGGKSIKRVAYAVSFGCTQYPPDVESFVKPMLADFSAISVREATGLGILERMGVTDAMQVADPTALLSREAYLRLLGSPIKKNNNVGRYILRRQQKCTNELINAILGRIQKGGRVICLNNRSLKRWLKEIARCRAIVTNSYHGIMMCIKLHTPFYAILETGVQAGMNDRLYTLLRIVNLEDRIIEDAERVGDNEREIDWEAVDRSLAEYAESSEGFLRSNLT